MGFIQICFTCDFSHINLLVCLFRSSLEVNDCFCHLMNTDSIKGLGNYDNFGSILNRIYICHWKCSRG